MDRIRRELLTRKYLLNLLQPHHPPYLQRLINIILLHFRLQRELQVHSQLKGGSSAQKVQIRQLLALLWLNRRALMLKHAPLWLLLYYTHQLPLLLLLLSNSGTCSSRAYHLTLGVNVL